MRRIRRIDEGIVYRDDSGARHAYFPSIVELNHGELVVSADIGSGMEAADVCGYLMRSRDGGSAWESPEQICDGPSDTAFSTLCRLTRLDDETLVCLFAILDRSRLDAGLANPVTDGYVRTNFALTRSTDGGRTWTPLEPIAPPIDWHAYETCSPVVALDSQRWLLPTSTWRDWDGDAPHGMKAVAFVSDDAGKTWPRLTIVMDGWSNGIVHWEQKMARLEDGRLLAICWTYDLTNRKSLRNRFALSSDRGASFSEPRETPLDGETCTPLALEGNLVLCAYRRTDRPGLWAHLARIRGDAWLTEAAEVCLWGNREAAYGAQSSSMLEEMATLRFGYPQLLRRSNGEIMIVFWCVEDGVAGIRYVRVDIAV